MTNRDAEAISVNDEGVAQVVITITLERDYSAPVLRLFKGGSETTVVTVDSLRSFDVSARLLGSRDGYGVGSFNFDIGPLPVGAQKLEMTVADDGNGTCQWDALLLQGK